MRTPLTRVVVGIAFSAIAIVNSSSHVARSADIFAAISAMRAKTVVRFCNVAAKSVGASANDSCTICVLFSQSTLMALSYALTPTMNAERGQRCDIALVVRLNAVGAMKSTWGVWHGYVFVFDDTASGTVTMVALAVARRNWQKVWRHGGVSRDALFWEAAMPIDESTRFDKIVRVFPNSPAIFATAKL